MIWLGRLLSLPLGVILFVVILLTLIVLQVNDQFLDPDFYPEELRKANVYEFLLGDLLPTALDDWRTYEEGIEREAKERDRGESTLAQAEEFAERLNTTPLITSGLTTQDIVSSVNTALPPEWVQGVVEQVFEQFGKYLTGERDIFEVNVRAGDQVVILVDEIKSLLRKADAYDLLFEQVVDPTVADAVDLELPLDVDLSGERLVEAVRKIVEPEWVRGQVEAALDELTPYVIGERDTFEIKVLLGDRVEIALEEIKELLREADAYELLYSEVVEPAVVEQLGESVDLPLGITVTQEEIVDALRRVAPVEWVQEQVERLIDDVGPYLTGKEKRFATEVSLEDNKREASKVIVEIVDRRLSEAADKVPKCASDAEAASALAGVGSNGGLPKCIPGNFALADLLGRLNIDVGAQVGQLILGPIPNRIKFTDNQLRSALELAGAADNIELVDEVREILKDGWTYTHVDLQADLDESAYVDAMEDLNEIRFFLSNDWIYTDADFRDRVSKLSWDVDVSNVRPVNVGALSIDIRTPSDTVESVRSDFKFSRKYRWVAYLPMVILLVILGFLGGQGWPGRVGWAASFLLVFAGIIFLMFGPGYDTFAKSGPLFDAMGAPDVYDLRQEVLVEIEKTGGDFAATSRLAAEKGFDIAESVVDGFASGMASSGRNLALVGLVALVGSIFWSTLYGTVRRFLPGGEY